MSSESERPRRGCGPSPAAAAGSAPASRPWDARPGEVAAPGRGGVRAVRRRAVVRGACRWSSKWVGQRGVARRHGGGMPAGHPAASRSGAPASPRRFAGSTPRRRQRTAADGGRAGGAAGDVRPRRARRGLDVLPRPVAQEASPQAAARGPGVRARSSPTGCMSGHVAAGDGLGRLRRARPSTCCRASRGSRAAWSSAGTERPVTKFERRGLAEGRTITDLTYRRVA